MSKARPKTQASLNHTLAGAALSPPGTLQEEEDRAVALLDLAISLVDSAVDILTSHIRSDAQLKHPSKLLPGGTVGKHFRHVIETYRAFLLPLLPSSSSATAGDLEINYDAILPATRHPIARNLGVCRREMRKIKDDLEEFKERYRAPYEPTERGRGVAGDTDAGLTKVFTRKVRLVAVTPARQDLRSSIGRELWFCSLHAIHHFSMLRAIAVHELGLQLPLEFGTAPSTLLYREQKPLDQDPDRPKAKL